jgi:hypothetical protein
MTDNVIYGIDFRAGKEEAPLCNAPDVKLWDDQWARAEVNAVTSADTAPSEYCAPSDDCA